MIIKAQQKNLPVTPRKLQLMANAVKHLKPVEAVTLLEAYNKKSAHYLAKTIKQAIANATNNHKVSADSLRIQQILMGRGLSLKRFLAGARGRAKTFEKTRSHLTVLLESVELETAPKITAKRAKSETKKSAIKSAATKTKIVTKKITKKTVAKKPAAATGSDETK